MAEGVTEGQSVISLEEVRNLPPESRFIPSSDETREQRQQRQALNRQTVFGVLALADPDFAGQEGQELRDKLAGLGVNSRWYFPQDDNDKGQIKNLAAYLEVLRISSLAIPQSREMSKNEKMKAEAMEKAQREAQNWIAIVDDCIRFDQEPNASNGKDILNSGTVSGLSRALYDIQMMGVEVKKKIEGPGSSKKALLADIRASIERLQQ